MRERKSSNIRKEKESESRVGDDLLGVCGGLVAAVFIFFFFGCFSGVQTAQRQQKTAETAVLIVLV